MVLLARKHPHGLWEHVRDFASLQDASDWLSERHDPTFRTFAPEDWAQLQSQCLTMDTFVAPRDVQVEMDSKIRGLSDEVMLRRLAFLRELHAQVWNTKEDEGLLWHFFVDNLMAAAYLAQPLFTEGEFARLAQAAMARLRDALRREQELKEQATKAEESKEQKP